jgi:glucokinase
VSATEAIGVDLGGTKLLVGVVAPGPAVLHRNLATAHGRSEQGVLELLERELRAALLTRPGAAAIGLGVPCTIDRRRGVCVQSVNLPLRELPLRDLLAERIGLPVTMDNDANLALLAECRFGAARGASNAILMTIGTGIGGGIMIDGHLFRGSHGAGAELGHIVVDADGPACQGACPNRGCIEAVASGTAMGREGVAAAAAHSDSLLAATLARGEAIDGRAVVEAARAGDAAAAGVVELIGRRLGIALSGLANAFDPDVIVLGGGVLAAGEALLGPAREELRRRALPPQNEVPLRAAELGGDAGMIGAATLALEELGGRVASGTAAP